MDSVHPAKEHATVDFAPRVQTEGLIFSEALPLMNTEVNLKVHKIEIFFGFDFEICIISLLVMSKY